MTMTKTEQLDELAQAINQVVCDDDTITSMAYHMVEGEIGRDCPTHDDDEEYWRTNAIILMKGLLRAAEGQIVLVEKNLN